MNKHFISLFFLLAVNQTAFSWHTRHEDRVTIIDFDTSDIQNNGVIEEDSGWRLGCFLKTPVFQGQKNTNIEVQTLIEFEGAWDGITPDLKRALNFNLGKIILEYFDALDFSHEVIRSIKATDFGSVHLFGEHPRGNIYYGETVKPNQISLSPTRIPKGAKNISLNICEVAPNTKLKIHKVEVRLRPLE